MNPYERFRTVANFLASAGILAVIIAYGASGEAIIRQVAGSDMGVLAGLIVAGMMLVILWTVLASVILPALLKTGLLRRLILGRAYVEGSWIQAERGGPNGARIAILSLKPSRHGLILSSTTLTRGAEIESALHSEYDQMAWPKLEFKFRETVPADSGKQAEGIGEIQFDLTSGAPQRYSGSLLMAGSDTCIKTDGIKLTRWRERRRMNSLEGRRDVLEKYWSALFEGPIGTVARQEKTDVLRPKAIVTHRRASDWRKSDTTPTADRIREEIAVPAD